MLNMDGGPMFNTADVEHGLNIADIHV